MSLEVAAVSSLSNNNIMKESTDMLELNKKYSFNTRLIDCSEKTYQKSVSVCRHICGKAVAAEVIYFGISTATPVG